MGASINVVDNIILVHPGSQLHAAVVHADEIRAGACLMLTVSVKGGVIIQSSDVPAGFYHEVLAATWLLLPLSGATAIQGVPTEKPSRAMASDGVLPS